MTEVKAILRFVRISPRKTRMLVDLIRGKNALVAESQLRWQPGKPAIVVLKLLRSAIANAVHNSDLVKESLTIKSIMVDGGPVLKRFTPKAFGRGTAIRKPTSHITLVLMGTVKNQKNSKLDEVKVNSDDKVKKMVKIEDKKEKVVTSIKSLEKNQTKEKLESEKKKSIKKSEK
jgi:large subunit ribosomal protein L22